MPSLSQEHFLEQSLNVIFVSGTTYCQSSQAESPTSRASSPSGLRRVPTSLPPTSPSSTATRTGLNFFNSHLVLHLDHLQLVHHLHVHIVALQLVRGQAPVHPRHGRELQEKHSLLFACFCFFFICRNDILVTGGQADFCPRVSNGTSGGSSEILVSSGQRKSISVKVDHIAQHTS